MCECEEITTIDDGYSKNYLTINCWKIMRENNAEVKVICEFVFIVNNSSINFIIYYGVTSYIE